MKQLRNGDSHRNERGVCPKCGKKGLSNWKHLVDGYDAVKVRSCRYCNHFVKSVIASY